MCFSAGIAKNGLVVNSPKSTIVRGHGEIILVIDDEPAVRDVVRSLLKTYGYSPLVANDGPSGLALYQEQQTSVKVVITDMMMPGLQGVGVIRELRKLNSDVRIVAMSGVVSERAGIGEEPGRLALLPKPMTGAELIGALQRVMPASG